MKGIIVPLPILGVSAFLATGCAIVKPTSCPWAERAEAVRGGPLDGVRPGSEAYDAAQNASCLASLLRMLVR